MSRNTDVRAIERRRDALAAALACVTATPFRWGGGRRGDQPYVLLLGDGELIALPRSPLSLAIIEQVRVADDKPRAVAYSYAVGVGGRELLAYHWHPAGVSTARTPHLHVQADVEIGGKWLGKAHLPTAVVSPLDVLLLLVEDLGACPLRDDWRTTIEVARGE